jgi:hypothetical protein
MGWRLLSWFWGADEPPVFVAASEARTAFGPIRDRTARGYRNDMADTRFVITLNVPKPPRAEEVFNWDFTGYLAPTDTIASIEKSFLEEGDPSLVLVATPALSTTEQKVSQLLTGGRRGTWYAVTCGVRTTLGELLWLTLRFYCA